MNELKVLDHGSVILRNLAGPTRRPHDRLPPDQEDMADFRPRAFDADDIDVAQAARLSFEQMDSERTYEQDMKLNRYLMEHDHTSPFEMIQVWVEVRVPIFIDRQMVRHRTWRRNESSARYIVLPNKWYVPEVVGAKPPPGGAKQGQVDTLDAETQGWFKNDLQMRCKHDYDFYEEALRRGVAPEHARMALHLNHYVHWIGNVDLHNLFQFLKKRVDKGAQIEARAYGNAIMDLLRPHLPGLMGLFDEIVRKPEGK